MPREKVTLTLDSGRLAELRQLAGARSLSAAVDNAVTAYIARLQHLSAVDDWLAELERDYGPVPAETLDWAATIVDSWARSKGKTRRRAG